MNEFLQQILNGLAIGSVYTLVALGLTVVFGILGIAHFAHGSLAMFGGYLTFVFSTSMGLSFFASIARHGASLVQAGSVGNHAVT